MHTITGHTDWNIAASPNGSKIVSGGSVANIKIWDATNGSLIHILKGHAHAIWSLAFSPDGSKIVSGSQDETIKIWNINDFLLTHTLKDHTKPVFSVAFSPDGSKLYPVVKMKLLKYGMHIMVY